MTSDLSGPLRLSSTQTEILTKAIRYILTEWPSLNFAIENGMGGPDAKQKHAWMVDHIIEIILSGKDVDLDDYLAEMINQEFDTLVEDGSLEYNTKWITKFHRDCLQGKEQEVLSAIDQACSKKQSLGSMRIPAPQEIKQDNDDDDDDDDDYEDEEMS